MFSGVVQSSNVVNETDETADSQPYEDDATSNK